MYYWRRSFRYKCGAFNGKILPIKLFYWKVGGFEYDDRVQELYNGKITGILITQIKQAGAALFWRGLYALGRHVVQFDDIDFEKETGGKQRADQLQRKDIVLQILPTGT